MTRLLDELRMMLTEPGEQDVVRRLFPVVHPENAEREAEYQRLMRDELVRSRLAGIEAVEQVLGRSGRKVAMDEAELLAFVQAVNSLRLVLGTLLDISEDDDLDPAEELLASPEYQLYGYLSWVLDGAVRALSPEP